MGATMNQVATTVQPPASGTDGSLLITIAEAERLCNLPPRTGYQLIKTDWAGFVVRYGIRKGGIRIHKGKLMKWINGESTAA
jgi:hypothetical protein